MQRYQIVDPYFTGDRLGGWVVTWANGIGTVMLDAESAAYWLTMGAIIPAQLAVNYPLVALDAVVSGIAIDAPTFVPSVPLIASDLDVAPLEIDAP